MRDDDTSVTDYGNPGFERHATATGSLTTSFSVRRLGGPTVPSACVLTDYGSPDVLEWEEVTMPEPSETQIRIKVHSSGVGPTDLKIRRGELTAVMSLPQPAVLGFETAGTVDRVGNSVEGIAVGDEVAAWLPSLGGYGEYALAENWAVKP